MIKWNFGILKLKEGGRLDKIIDLSKSVYELCMNDPEVIDIMKTLGFDNITGKGTLNTVGRVMTIPKGAKMKNIPLQEIIKAFEKEGYTILPKEDNYE